MLTIEHGSIRRGLRRVLERHRIEVADPAVVGVVGVNGSGKTSLFMHLADALLWSRPESRMSIDGRPLRCAWVPQDAPLPPWQRVEEVALLHGFTFDHLMESMPGMLLHELAGQRVRALSTGQRQALAVALALAIYADVTLLDEPFAALDFRRHVAACDLVARHRAAGRSILLSSQSADDLSSLCDHFIVLRDGRCIFDGTRDELLEPAAARHEVGQPRATIEERLLALLT